MYAIRSYYAGDEFFSIAGEIQVIVDAVFPIGAAHHVCIQPVDAARIAAKTFTNGFAVGKFAGNLGNGCGHRLSPG